MPPSATHLLLVDDEEVDREVIRRILERAGFLVTMAAGYYEAMGSFDQHSETIDLLISDISLPARNGVELAKALLREKPDLKVLLISGWVGAEIMHAHGIPSADHHFLPKPFTASVLLDRVREILANNDAWEWLDPSRKDDREGRSNGP